MCGLRTTPFSPNMISHLLIDLDDTLYATDSGVWPAISSRISEFMRTKLGMAPQEIQDARARYTRSFGTSLAGLMADHAIAAEEYLAFVHDIPIDSMVQPDPELREMLAKLPQYKAVFTNASRAHAQRVLRALEVSDLFDQIISIETLGLVNKPELAAYTRALSAMESTPEASSCLFADDRVQNLIPASRLGMTTVLVNRKAEAPPEIDHSIERIHKLTATIPALLESAEDHGVA